MADRGHPKEGVCTKQEKVTEQILKNLAKSVKIVILSPMGGPNRGLGDSLRVIQWRPALHG